MAAGSNSNPHSRWRLALSVLCAFALLLVSVPCAMCSPQTVVRHGAISAAHCDDCCPSTQAMPAAKACCTVQTPAAISVIQAIHAAPAADGLLACQPVVAAAVHAVATNRVVHPPLLKTNLRI